MQRASALELAALIPPGELDEGARLLHAFMPPGHDPPDVAITAAILAATRGTQGLRRLLHGVRKGGRDPDIRSYGWFLSVARAQRKMEVS